MVTAFGWIVIGFGTIAVSVLWGGFTLSVVWNWFIPSIFGITPLTIGQAIGLQMVVSMFTSGLAKTEHTNEKGEKLSGAERIGQALGRTIGTPAFILLFAWVVKAIAL